MVQHVLGVLARGRGGGQVPLVRGIRGADDPVVVPRDDEQHGLLRLQDDAGGAVQALLGDHDVNALGGQHLQAGLGLREVLDRLGPHTGGGDHDLGAHLAGLPRGEVLDVGPDHAAGVVTDQVAGRGAVRREGPVALGRAHEVQGQAGVVHATVPVGDGAHGGVVAHGREGLAHAGGAEVALDGQGLGLGAHVGEGVVHADARGHEGAFPALVGQRVHELDGLDQVRGQPVHQEVALLEGLRHEREVQLHEVAQPAVHQLGGARGGALGPVLRVDDGGGQTTGGRVQGDPSARDAAADHQDVHGVLRHGAEVVVALLCVQRGQWHGCRSCLPVGS